MTQEDQDAIIGKAHREYADAKKELAALRVRLDNIAQAASNLANALNNPSRMAIPESDGQAVVVVGVAFMFTDEVARQLSRDYVGHNVKDYIATKRRVDALRQRLTSLGQNPTD